MRHLSAYALVVASLLGLSSVAVACMWDYDTIRMERTRFPGTLELITGKFLRHSPEFYEWRIANRLKRLETDPTNVAWLDDLAVAYDKTGQHDQAIATAIAEGHEDVVESLIRQHGEDAGNNLAGLLTLALTPLPCNPAALKTKETPHEIDPRATRAI